MSQGTPQPPDPVHDGRRFVGVKIEPNNIKYDVMAFGEHCASYAGIEFKEVSEMSISGRIAYPTTLRRPLLSGAKWLPWG